MAMAHTTVRVRDKLKALPLLGPSTALLERRLKRLIKRSLGL
jgi:hypothetical protein